MYELEPTLSGMADEINMLGELSSTTLGQGEASGLFKVVGPNQIHFEKTPLELLEFSVPDGTLSSGTDWNFEEY